MAFLLMNGPAMLRQLLLKEGGEIVLKFLH